MISIRLKRIRSILRRAPKEPQDRVHWQNNSPNTAELPVLDICPTEPTKKQRSLLRKRAHRRSGSVPPRTASNAVTATANQPAAGRRRLGEISLPNLVDLSFRDCDILANQYFKNDEGDSENEDILMLFPSPPNVLPTPNHPSRGRPARSISAPLRPPALQDIEATTAKGMRSLDPATKRWIQDHRPQGATGSISGSIDVSPLERGRALVHRSNSTTSNSFSRPSAVAYGPSTANNKVPDPQVPRREHSTPRPLPESTSAFASTPKRPTRRDLSMPRYATHIGERPALDYRMRSGPTVRRPAISTGSAAARTLSAGTGIHNPHVVRAAHGPARF